jgi:type IV secretory pathway TrbD component
MTRQHLGYATRHQRSTVVNGILCFVLILVVLQLWLLTATMNAWLGGDDAVVWPALGASVACLLLNLGLLRYLLNDNRERHRDRSRPEYPP